MRTLPPERTAARRLLLCAIILLAIEFGLGLVHAADSVLTNLVRAHAALRDAANTTPTSARFSGVTIFTEPPSTICLQDGKLGVLVETPPAQSLPKLGDRVEVEAAIQFTQGTQTEPPRIRATSARVIGHPGLPKPHTPWLLDALGGSYDGTWFESEGVVMQARMNDDVLWLHVTDESGWAVVNVYNWNKEQPLTNWWGARVHFFAANIGRGHKAVRVPSPEYLTLVHPGATNEFSAPATTVAELRAQTKSDLERRRLKATILFVDGDTIYLRGDNTGLHAGFLHPFEEGTKNPDLNELIPPPIPTLTPGDEVELVGSLLKPHWPVKLSFSSFRILKGNNPPPEPQFVSAQSIQSGAAADNFVRVSGRLLSVNRSNSSPGVRDIFRIENDGASFQAILDRASDSRLNGFHPDDTLELSGMVVPTDGEERFALRLRSIQDVRTLGLAPGVERLRAARTIGIAAALLVLAAGWIVFLRFKLVEGQRGAEAMTRMNAALEQRVKERTAELEVAHDGLRRALHHERELHELKSRFISMVSHEFRTPLSIIMSSTEILDAYLDRLSPEERAQNLRDIFEATHHMGSMVDEVLFLSRVEAGKMICRPAPLDLEGFCRKLAAELTTASHDRCPVIWCPPGKIPAAFADESLLRHILTNLIGNSIKYSASGSPVEFELEVSGSMAIFFVRDKGIGMSETDAKQVFEAFHRGANVGDRQGHGLGMAIAKSCVELHDGEIHVQSDLGRGTTVKVSLPLFDPQWRNDRQSNENLSKILA